MVDWALSRGARLRSCIAWIAAMELLAACGRSELNAGSARFDFASGGAARGGIGGHLNGGQTSFGGALGAGGTLSAGGFGGGGQADGGAGLGGGGVAGASGNAGFGGVAGAGGNAGENGKRCPHGMVLGEPPLLELGGSGWRVAVSGDFNQDGVLDFATATDSNRSVHIFFGAGDGTFVHGQEFDAGNAISEMLAVDVDKDGRLDLIVSASQGVSVWLDRPGGFSQRLVSDTAVGLTGIQSTDINGDGRPDLIAAHSVADAAYVRLGAGDGTFLEPHEYPSGSRPGFVTAGDLNGDGVLDLVSVSRDAETLNVLLGHHDGSFAAAVAYTSPFLAERVALADLNADDVLDVVAGPAPRVNGAVTRVWLGLGDGRLAAPTDTAMDTSQSWALDDIDGDRRLDLVASYPRSEIVVCAGRGDGSFAPAVAHRAIVATSFLIGDANNDQQPDIIAFGGDAFTLLNVGSGRFLTRSALWPYDTGEVRAADLDNDGIPDLVAASADTVNHFLNQGAGHFGPAETTSLADYSDSMADADFDRDGYPDHAVAFPRDGFRILWGGAGGRIVASVEYPLEDARGIAAGDLNGDRFPDLVLTRTESLVVYLGPSFSVSSEYANAASASRVTIADVSGDGRLDVASLHYKAGTLGVFLGDGRGALAPPVETAVGLVPGAVAFGDLGGDSRVEGVVADFTKSQLHVLTNEGGGKFSIRHTYEGIFSARELAIADMDADGNLDVLSANQGGSVDLLRGLGNGALAAVERYPTGRNTVSLAIADFDGDNRPDVAVGAEQLDILLNRCR